MIRKKGLGELALTEHTEGKSLREKQRVAYLENLYKWMSEHGQGEMVRGQNLLRGIKDMNMCGGVLRKTCQTKEENYNKIFFLKRSTFFFIFIFGVFLFFTTADDKIRS